MEYCIWIAGEVLNHGIPHVYVAFTLSSSYIFHCLRGEVFNLILEEPGENTFIHAIPKGMLLLL